MTQTDRAPFAASFLQEWKGVPAGEQQERVAWKHIALNLGRIAAELALIRAMIATPATPSE